MGLSRLRKSILPASVAPFLFLPSNLISTQYQWRNQYLEDPKQLEVFFTICTPDRGFIYFSILHN